MDQENDFKEGSIFVFTNKDNKTVTRQLHNTDAIVCDSADELETKAQLDLRSRKGAYTRWSIRGFYKSNRKKIVLCAKVLLLLAYLTYYVYCIRHKFGDEGSFILTGITVAIFVITTASLLHEYNVSLSIIPQSW
ncbi:hypothetical protein EGW08_010688, partial [Elysia chlorotica]